MGSGGTWSINGRFLSQPITGVQRYAREIVQALDKLVGEHHPLTHDLRLEVLIPPGVQSDQRLQHIPTRTIGRQTGHLWEQLDLPRHAAGGIMSLCNTGPVSAHKHVVCIHDMNTRLAPQSYTFAFRLAYRALLPVLGRRAQIVATVSKFSAEALEHFGVAAAGRIRVVPNGCEHVLSWTPRATARTRRIAERPTVVTIGSLAPHKNIRLLLDLAPELEREGIGLAIAGGLDRNVFARRGIRTDANNVTWLGRVTDDELADILDRALCLAFPSETEGFGLPPLEAMTRGCPIVVSRAASLPEICGDAALYAAPHDRDQWLANIVLLARQPDLAQRLREKGRLMASRFSWRRSAEMYLEALAEIDGRSRPAAPVAQPTDCRASEVRRASTTL